MHVATNILVVGFLIFVAHALTGLFSRTSLPDVLILTLIGITLGPIFHLVKQESFGAVGPVFDNVTLVILLFEAGLSLDFDILRGTVRSLFALTFANFGLTMLTISLAGYFLLGLAPQMTLMLGAILASTSPAVIVPLAKRLRISESSKTVLFLESAFSDVLSIVVAAGFMRSYQQGHFSLGPMLGQLIATFVLAGIAGVLSAFGWSTLLRRIRGLENSMFTTPAFVFVLFGVVELLGFSGYVAAAVFGAVLGNIEVFHGINWLRRYFPSEAITLDETERVFLAEVVFLFKTFFFVYVGVSIKFTDVQIVWVGLAITTLIFLIRIPATWIGLNRSTPVHDAALTAIMAPKGLAAVVLASLPLEQHLPNGDVIQSLTYTIVFMSIVVTSLLSFLMERTRLAKIYGYIFRRFGRTPLPPGLPLVLPEG